LTNRFKPWLAGAGLALLYLLPLIAIVLSRGQDTLYHQMHPTTSLARAALLDLVGLGSLAGAVFLGLERVRGEWLRRLLWLGAGFLTAVLAERALVEMLRDFGHAGWVRSWFGYLPWGLLAAGVVLIFAAPAGYWRLVESARVLLLSAGLTAAVVIAPSLVHAGLVRQPQDRRFFRVQAAHPWQAGQRRVVWLLFDELSYRQAFEHPQPGVRLPAFEQLREQGVSFSDLQPIGEWTERVIPSLLIGQEISDVTSNRNGELFFRERPEKPWRLYPSDQTIFAMARRAGWGSGVAGWFNPYCRTLAGALDRCYWTYLEPPGAPCLSTRRGALANAWYALPLPAALESCAEARDPRSPHARDYDRLLEQGRDLIGDEAIRFAFVHLPVPHPPGIYPDPMEGRPDYIGNLLLADRTLATLRAAIAATPAAKDTILVVSSDHSWRASMWRHSPAWTREEERASPAGAPGSYDGRPVLMVSFPPGGAAIGGARPGADSADSGVTIERPVTEMILHSLMLGLVSGSVNGPEDVERLAAGAGAASGR
jgi:hypothetical protein